MYGRVSLKHLTFAVPAPSHYTACLPSFEPMFFPSLDRSHKVPEPGNMCPYLDIANIFVD